VSAGAFCAAVIAVPVMSSANFTSSSCLSGQVEAYDYAELEQNLAETFTDRRAVLEIQSESAELTLAVSDLEGNSVCENVADLQTRCQWSLGDRDVFIIKIDNTMRATSTAYELCAR
jgi:hypothetical protein